MATKIKTIADRIMDRTDCSRPSMATGRLAHRLAYSTEKGHGLDGDGLLMIFADGSSILSIGGAWDSPEGWDRAARG